MSLQPAKHNFHIWKGATFQKRVTYFEDAARTQPKNLTGYTADLTIRDAPDGTPLLTLTHLSGLTLGGAAGTIHITIDAATTAALPWTAGVYDLLVTSPGGQADALLWGAFGVRGV